MHRGRGEWKDQVARRGQASRVACVEHCGAGKAADGVCLGAGHSLDDNAEFVTGDCLRLQDAHHPTLP